MKTKFYRINGVFHSFMILGKLATNLKTRVFARWYSEKDLERLFMINKDDITTEK